MSLPRPDLSLTRHFENKLIGLDLPTAWSIEERSGQAEAGHLVIGDAQRKIKIEVTIVTRPEVESALQLLATTPRQAAENLRQYVAGFTAVRFRHEPHPLTGTAHPMAAAEGTEYVRVRGKRGLLAKLAGRKTVMVWRFWAALSPHLLLLAHCAGKLEDVEESRLITDRLIKSVHLPNQALLAGRPFSEAVIRIVKNAFPAQTVALLDDAHLSFNSFQVNLASLHQSYLNAPEALPDQMRSFFSRLLKHREQTTEGLPAWQDVRNNVLPELINQKDLDRMRRLASNWAIQPLANDISVRYLAPSTTGGDRRTVILDDTTRWGVDLDMLHEQALQNLIAASADLTMEGDKDDAFTILAFTKPDGANAARILLPDLHHRLREYLGGTFWVAIPNREFLLAFSMSRPDLTERIRTQVLSHHSKLPHPLTSKLFLLTPDGIAGDIEENG